MEKAYMRVLQHTHQCELVFPLKITDESGEIIIEQEIHAVRGCNDNIQSLLDHTKRKISKILETKAAPSLEMQASLTSNGRKVVAEQTCKAFTEETRKNVIFKIGAQSFDVVLNAPLVLSITLPVMLYVNYALQPLKFKCIYTDKKLCYFVWFTSPDKISWSEVGTSFKYKPTLKDVNKFLKLSCTPRNAHAEGPVYEAVSSLTITEMCSLPICPFEERHKLTPTRLPKNEIRVVSYNTLSDLYSDTNSQFPYCTSRGLSIDYRKQLIVKELLGYNADIICLQEVDHHVFNSYLKPKLSKDYKGVFHKKGNRVPEGLACFFSQDKFKLIESKLLVFCSEIRSNPLFKRTWNLLKMSDSIKDCFIKQPTSLQVTVLKSKEPHRLLVVANTHLYYHSEANDVRLLQTRLALDYIKDMCNKYKRSSNRSDVSVIFCGDFNSVPTSSVYDLFTRGVIQHTFDKDKETPIRNICVKHDFQFASAYGTPKYTNFTDDFKGCLDYIFYETNKFSVTKCVPIPDEAVLAEHVALPSEVFPSDHIALIVDLKWS